jgi:hypothetical protein
VLCTDLAAIERTRLPMIAGDIAILAWPRDADRADQLAREQVPRLFLVDSDADPPEHWDRLTDWVRLPADERDIEARLITIRRRVRLPGNGARPGDVSG